MTTEIQMANHGGLVKLFGATIRVAPQPPPSTAAACQAEHREAAAAAPAALQVLHNDKKPKTDDDDSRTTEEQKQQPLPNRSEEQSGSPADDIEVEAVDEEKKKQGEKSSLTKKKPDKLLPCPRCDSMDTKFCYYNNYNVNQPRHFCRVCQRYWTAGGAVRPNMPVGAGRRKKPSRSAGASARCQLDGDVVVVLDSVGSDGDNHAVTTVSPRDSGEILSFGNGMGSPSSNFSPVKPRQLSSMGEQAIARVESCPPVVAPQIAWPVTGVANPPPQLYFYGGNQGPPASAAVCGIAATAGGFAPSPQPVHLCWTSTPTAAAGWQVFSLVPWAPQMASYNPTPAPSRPIPTPIAVRKHSHSQSQSHSHDTDHHSFGSSGVEDSLSRQSSSSLEISPRAKVAAKKRSFAIREEEEEEVGACGSYQLRTDMSARRTEVASKVLQSNPAAMLRSLNFQETV